MIGQESKGMEDKLNGQTEEQPPKPSRFKRFLRFLNKSEWVSVFLTFVIAATGVVGIILVIQGGRDTARIRDAAEKQASSASKSVQASRDFADTAALINSGIGDAVKKLDRQAKATEYAMKSEQRAYVLVEVHSIFPDQPQKMPLVDLNSEQAKAIGLSPGMHWCEEINSINIGKTPTIGERTTAFATIEQNPRSTVEAFTPPPYPYKAGTVGIPKMFHRTCTNEVIDRPTLDELIGKDRNIFTYGVVQYRDIYGDYRETGFCLIVTAHSGAVRGCGYGSWFDKRPDRKQHKQAN